MEWWQTADYDIDDLENEEWAVEVLKARQIDGVWEYAIVRWRYNVPTLVRLFCDGKVLQTEDA